MNLLALLQEKGVIDSALSARAETYAVDRGVSYEQALLEEGVDDDSIRNALGTYFSLPTEALPENIRIDPEVLQYVPEESARHYGLVPLRIQDGVLEVGVRDPEDLALRDALNFITAKHQLPYKLVVLLERDLERGLKSYENLSGEVGEALDELESELDVETKKAVAAQEEESPASQIEHIQEDAPITKIVATILRYAVDGAASDIHIEPTEKKVVVRFRVDGVLRNSLELPQKVHPAVVARTKILSSLRLDEKRKPQDGRFSATIDGRKIDFRVSILPTNHGEKVVMRILDTELGVRTLEDTGVSEYNMKLIRKAIKQPYGIILISGPTGSGKSTTLYAMLSEVDREAKNVLSLEDPVEYDIAGVNQSQIRPEIGYTFANGLRSALRQDPDVIMVGEIRDTETAQLAIQAALTGHLVLSTIHTNNSAGVIPRLIDMGIDPYLIAPTLQLALAQRLVRRICPNSGRKVPVDGSVKMMIDSEFQGLTSEHKKVIPSADHVLFAEPTPECASGTKGRVAVMEAIEITPAVEKLILGGGTEEDILAEARKNGHITMKEDAIIKALQHDIPFEEVNTLGGALLVSDEAEEEARALAVDNRPAENT
ncbi:Flp pilus assembly complex ATPase component TadA [Candidatus Kaiserbacteria bacterium]|nr:Flp pilus assembly complex ATPase component TadA [Candidatus Kaiserbacteria bacterium]